MGTMLALSVGEGVGLVHGFDIGRLMFIPIYFLPVLAIGFAVAPALSERLPISWNPSNRPPGRKPPFGYAVRSSLFMVFGLALVALLGVVLFLVKRFT